MKQRYRLAPLIVLPAAILMLVSLGWLTVLGQREALTSAAISAYQQTQLEIVRALARSIESYVHFQVEVLHRDDRTGIEQEILQQFVGPVRLLDNGDAWIYAPDHVVFDLSSDFPAEYRGKSMAEIFAMQQSAGANHYEAMRDAVMTAQEGVGWYIWLPDKGREIAAWTPVQVGTYVWTIGLSTPLPEILVSTGAEAQMQRSYSLMGVATLLTLGLLIGWWSSTKKRMDAEQALQLQQEHYTDDLRHQVEQRTAELRKTNEALQSEIAERIRTEQSLILARDAAEVASRAKSAFLSTMSHELRTPLTAILGYNDLAMIEAEAQQSISLLPDLQAIQISGQHLLKLINGVLELAKIEAGKINVHIEECYIDDLINKLVTTIRPLVEQNRNELVISCDPTLGIVATDITKVRQILINLLSNAAKFTTDGTITLAVVRERSQPQEHSSLIFTVSDTGIGIDESQITRIFDAFIQADAHETATTQGTGLGLTISYQFARLMGGSLTVKSTVGRGSVFTLQLPIDEAEPHSVQAHSPTDIN